MCGCGILRQHRHNIRPKMDTVKSVFISYSHDDVEHKSWVRRLATRLRQSGVDAILDQWDLVAGEDLPIFMEHGVRESDFVILVCTSRYVQKANGGQGGVGYEKMIVTSALAKAIDQRKFIPIVRQTNTNDLPTFLASKVYVDFSKSDDFEIGVDDLLRAIFKHSIALKPPLGVVDLSHIGTDASPGVVADGRLSPLEQRVLRAIVSLFNATGDSFVDRADVAKCHPATYVAIDVATESLRKKKLVDLTNDDSGRELIILRNEGKAVALELNLVDDGVPGSWKPPSREIVMNDGRPGVEVFRPTILIYPPKKTDDGS